MTIQVALQALGEATKLLASRTAANRLTMFHGTASGPNNSRLRSILKHGLIPTAPKAWADDPDARQAGRRSRASYGGTYFTANPRIALSSVYKARGDDKSQYPVIITATIQPRAALPDEDDYTFGVDHAYHYAVKTVDHPHTDGYYYLCLFLDGFNNGDLEEARKRFADNIAGMLKERGVSLELPRLRRFTDPLFDAEVVRRVSNQPDDWYGFKKHVQGRALDYFKFYKKTPLELDQLPAEIQKQPTYEEGETQFRAALDALTKATRRLAIGLETHSQDAPERFGHVLRVMEPVTFRGRNRITSIVSLPNYYSRGTGTPITVVSHYGDPTAIVKHLESEGYTVEVISPGVQLAASAQWADPPGYRHSDYKSRNGKQALKAVAEALALVQAARPIPVDKADIRETVDAIVTNVVRELRRRHPQDEPLGDLAPRFFVWSGEIDNPDLLTVTGQPVGPIDIIVTSQIGKGPSLILGGGIGRKRVTGKRALVITLNGRYTVDALMKSLPFQKEELFSLLIHEFTHFKDKLGKLGYRKTIKKMGPVLPTLGDDLDESAYYNDPDEVRAHMQEIVEQVLALASSVRTLFDPNKTVRIALSNSQLWRDVSPHLTAKNKKIIMKAVYTALQDAGLLQVPASQIKARRSPASYVSAAAYTDESGKFWGAQGAGAVFLAEDTGRILIQHRSPYVNEPNTWGVIGGAIDAQEDPQAAMEREVHEETGYNGQMRVEKLYVFQSGKFRYTNFLVTVPHEFSPHHGWESQGHVWTTLDDLPEPLHFGFKAVLPSLQQRLGQEAVSAATTPLPELSSKEPGLMTVGEFIASRNPKATYHTSDAYDFDLKKLNRDFSLSDKGIATVRSVKYNVVANNKGFLIYEDKVLVAVIHDGVLYKGKSAKTLPSGYIDYRNREYTDFGVTATKTVKYPAEYVRLVSDVAKNNLATYKVLLRSALVSGEPMQVRAKEQPEKNKGVSLAVINERGEIVAEATDEWGATLLVVAQEYRGKNLGQLIGKFWYMFNPDWESGGFTKGGEENATKIWEDRVREFLANGWYSELVRQGTLTKQRVEEITSGLRPRKQKKEELKVEDKKGEVLVYVDDPKEPVSFVIYDSQFLEDQDDKYILAHGFFRSSENVGSFLYKLDYERPYAKLATYVALQMARANGEPIYTGEGYGDLLELEGLENVTVDGDYASLTKDVLPLATIAAQERRARKPFDQYQQVYHSLLEQADSKW